MAITLARGGLFACFFGALNNIRWCKKNNVVPVVKWGEASLYYDADGYNGASEPWEYYFEPVSTLKYEDAILRKDTIYRDVDAAPDGSKIPATFHTQYYKSIEKDYRRSFYRIIVDHTKIKPQVLDQVETFYNDNLAGRKVIGIHMRGTDKYKEHKNKKTSVEAICQLANARAKSFPQCVFFVATDEERLLLEAQELLKGPVVYYECFRSLNGMGIHNSSKHGYNKAKLGEEVLIETLLLSKCDLFIHTKSNVSTAVLFFNPDLENVLVE